MVRLFLALLASLTLAAATFAQESGPSLRRGVSVHEWLNWSPLEEDGSYRWPPYRSIEEWLSGGRPLSDWPTGDQFTRIREMGFDFVRLSVDPGPLLATQGAKRQEALDVLRAAVGQVTGAGLAAVLDLHAVGQKPEYSLAGLDSNANSEGTRRYRGMVADVAGMLAMFDTSSVALEPFNEPGFYPCGADSSGEWQKIMAAVVSDIRAVSADLTVIATGACGGSIAGLIDLDPSFDDPSIRYSFHMYQPHSFTHQRSDDPDGFVSGLPWPAATGSLTTSIAELKARMQADNVDPVVQALNLAAFQKIATDYFEADAGQTQLDALLDQAVRWAEERDIPTERLFMGEFGTILMTPDGRMGAHNVDRLRYLTALRKGAERFGIPWSIWEYSNPYGMSVILPEGSAEADPDLLQALGLSLAR